MISHGSPGCLYLGNSQLSLDTLKGYEPQLQQWQLDNLVLYGCNVAAGDGGEEFIHKLHRLTGAEIAASKSLTGAAVKGGNWELEVRTAQTKPSLALQVEAMASYPDTLELRFEWAKQIGSRGVTDWISSITTDSSGNVLVVGSYSRNVDIDGDGNNDLISHENRVDGYVAKFDSNGNFIWAKRIAGGGHDHALTITTDSSDNILMGGKFYGSIDVDSDGNSDLKTSGFHDGYVVKLDSNGNLLWAKNIGNGRTRNEQVQSITTDSSGNVLVRGNFSGDVDINRDGENDLSSKNGFHSYPNDSYTVKFDSNGNLLWAKNMNGAITTDSSGNLLVAHTYNGSIDIDGDGQNDLTSLNSSQDGYVAKFDSNGNLIWHKNIGGSDNDNASSITTDSSDNVLVGGYFKGNIDIDGDGNNDLTSLNSSEDSYAAKFDSSGNLLWAKNIGGRGNDRAQRITTESNGNVLVTGHFKGNIDIDGDGNNDLTNKGQQDVYVAKLDSNGNFISAERIGGRHDDVVSGITTDSSGNVLVGGHFYNSNIDIDGDGKSDLTTQGKNDGFVVKFSDDTNSPPTDLDLDNKTIDENVEPNSVVGTFSTTDPDSGDSFTYTLVTGNGDTDNSAFAINGDQLQINDSPDYETKSSYNIRVQTTDGEGASHTEQLTINVNDVNE
ncbi:MAG: DUF4347 domain-containing protein, partial [Trichodesmium sp. St16_bin2-tuft]|nr:DUF4347 domain-containing protein [Trichodesmium sp. St16_bin2-tuft]